MDLKIVSRAPAFYGYVLRQYLLDEVNTVGVFGNEPFAIRFRNSSGQKVQVKLAVDGTDVVSGQKADLSLSRMWVVGPYATMELEAWPETTRGGARFVFTDELHSVAAHTHGDMSARGYISAAVFVEGWVPPPSIYDNLRGGGMTKGGPVTMGGDDFLESTRGPAVGAGSYVDQQIGSAVGLREPRFSQIVQVRYLWWDDLVKKLQEAGIPPHEPQRHPTGFEPSRLANLGSTPRVGSQPLTPAIYRRFE